MLENFLDISCSRPDNSNQLPVIFSVDSIEALRGCGYLSQKAGRTVSSRPGLVLMSKVSSLKAREDLVLSLLEPSAEVCLDSYREMW